MPSFCIGTIMLGSSQKPLLWQASGFVSAASVCFPARAPASAAAGGLAVDGTPGHIDDIAKRHYADAGQNNRFHFLTSKSFRLY
jgi:hypothetical protein